MGSSIFAPGLLHGQIVVVTGGGSGLGRATAVELAACGALLFGAGRRQEPLDEPAALCGGGGREPRKSETAAQGESGSCEGFACVPLEEDQVEAFVDGPTVCHGSPSVL